MRLEEVVGEWEALLNKESPASPSVRTLPWNTVEHVASVTAETLAVPSSSLTLLFVDLVLDLGSLPTNHSLVYKKLNTAGKH